MDISLVQGGLTVVLNGSGGAAPLRAGKIDLSVRGQAVIECALDGTAVQIATFQQSVEKMLVLGEMYAGLPGEDWAYLNVGLPDGTVWRSPVLASRSEALPGPGSRSGGSQGFKIFLTLEKWWENDLLIDVPLTNHYGSLVTGGLQTDNHQDAAHDNFVAVAPLAILGDVPAPVVLTLSATPNGLDFLVGQAVTNNVGAFGGVLEAENYAASFFVTTTKPADGGCSNGAYVAGSWSGSGLAGLVWGLDPTNYAARVYRPVLRLRDLVAGSEKILAWVRLSMSGETILDGEAVMLPTDRRLVVLPPLALPPWSKPPGGFAWEGIAVQLLFKAEGAGAHALGIDFLEFMPTEGWLRFYCVAPAATYSLTRYDGATGQNTRSLTAGVTHVPEGRGITLYPAVAQKIFVLNQNAAGSDISTVTTVRVQYRPRKRVL